MVLEKEFHEILEEKGIVKNCRDVWWKHWNPYQTKFGGSKESLEFFVAAVIKKECKVPCGL